MATTERTNHEVDIIRLRTRVDAQFTTADADTTRSLIDSLPGTVSLALLVAADLLELHDATGISLDRWPAARALVEREIGHEIVENHC